MRVPWRRAVSPGVLLAEEGYVKMFLRGRPVTMYMPRDQVDSYNLEAKVDLPPKRLKLEWVYPPPSSRLARAIAGPALGLMLSRRNP